MNFSISLIVYLNFPLIIIIIVNMEEIVKSQDQQTAEEQNSLLSFKMSQLKEKTHKYTTISTFASLTSKHAKITKQFELDGCSEDHQPLDVIKNSHNSDIFYAKSPKKQKTTPTLIDRTLQQPSSKFKKRNNTCLVPNQQKRSTKHQLTFKFLKSSLKGQSSRSVIYQPKISSTFQICGYGILFFSDGMRMQGNWICGNPEDKLRIKYKDKREYYGEVYQLKSHGFGQLTFPEGEKYVGEFCYGQFHGQGILYDRAGKVVMEGEWRRGKFFR